MFIEKTKEYKKYGNLSSIVMGVSRDIIASKPKSSYNSGNN